MLEPRRERVRVSGTSIPCSVAAPFAGMVVGKLVEVGQWVKRGDAAVERVAMLAEIARA